MEVLLPETRPMRTVIAGTLLTKAELAKPKLESKAPIRTTTRSPNRLINGSTNTPVK